MCMPKGYYIISKIDGTPLAKYDVDVSSRLGNVAQKINVFSKDSPDPVMAVFKDRCLVVNRDMKKA